MPRIEIKVACHQLSIDPSVKSIWQKMRNHGVKRKKVIKEVTMLLQARFIREVQHTTWLANVVLMKKSNGSWRMYIDLIDLNKACSKDSYPLPNIDHLVDNTSGFKTLSFIDAFNGYNQLKMHPDDKRQNSLHY